ncbi:hypothetical protein F511_38298 [Dorcoceras hygrometricum]|uniref:Dystroglycan-like n=1 Tax=Dorcoceras hygrometricum TaxID=472368 RepID=A0A2Z7BAW2_9LAMI|nr:hypothetical protein F511_38298 [Dorcoceras hygrometricum]
MASSLISSSHHVDFDSVFGMDDAALIQMFESLIATGLKEFLGCPAVFYEAALIEFFTNGSVTEDGMVVSTIRGTTVEISESFFAFDLPTEGLTDLSDVPKNLVFDARSLFSDSKEQVSISCMKKELKIQYRLLHDILAKTFYVKDGSFDAVTRDRFMLMTAITCDVKVNWSNLLFNVLKEMVTPGSRQAKGFAIQICEILKTIPGLVLGESRVFPASRVLTDKTIHRYVAVNYKVGGEADTDAPRVKKTPVKKAVSHRRPAVDIETAPVVKKKRTTKGKPLVIAQETVPLQIVEAAADAQVEQPPVPKRKSQKRKRRLVLSADNETINAPTDHPDAAVETTVDEHPAAEVGSTGEKQPAVEVAPATDDPDAVIKKVLNQLDVVFQTDDGEQPQGTVVEETVVAAKEPHWFDLPYDDLIAKWDAERPVVTASDTDEDVETMDNSFRSVQIAQNTVSVAQFVQMIDEPSSSESSSDDISMDFADQDTTAATSHSPPTISADVQNVLAQLRASVDLIQFELLEHKDVLGNHGGSGSRLPARQRKNKNWAGRRSIQFKTNHAMTIHRVFLGVTFLATRAWLRPVSRGNRHFTVGSDRLRQSGSRTPQHSPQVLNTLSSISVRESRIQYLCDPQWFRDTASRGPTTIVAPESQFPTCPSDHDSIGYPRMSASGESSTTMHRLLHASGSHPIPPPDDSKTNQYNQDLGLIHSTNGNHLESPKEGSSIDHQDDVKKIRETLSLHINNLERTLSDRFDAHDRTYRVLFNNVRHDMRDHKNLLSLDLKSYQQKVSIQVGAAALDTVDVRREVKAMNAKVDILSSRLDDVKKDVEATKEAISHQLLEFQSQAQANHIVLTDQLGQLVDYINRGGNAKKGEGESSRGPQPPPAVQIRDSGNAGGSGDAVRTTELTQADIDAANRQILERMMPEDRERERERRSKSRSGSYKRRRY